MKFKPAPPPMYNVIMHNDDETTMDFVVHVLVTVFRKAQADAKKIMLTIHREGSAVVGQYPKDIAESKAQKATKMAREQGYPLKITVEIDTTLPF